MKKCIPSNCSGLDIFSAIEETDNDDVLVAKIVSGLFMADNLLKKVGFNICLFYDCFNNYIGNTIINI